MLIEIKDGLLENSMNSQIRYKIYNSTEVIESDIYYNNLNPIYN